MDGREFTGTDSAAEEAARLQCLQEIRKDLKAVAYKKGLLYNYDFDGDRPLGDPNSRFQWETHGCEAGPAMRQSTLSTLTSLGSNLESDIPSIPDSR